MCLAVNPLKEALQLGLYPLYRSDRSQWNIHRDEQERVLINNECHQGYYLKCQENSLGLRPFIDKSDEYQLVMKILKEDERNMLCTFQRICDKKYVAFDTTLRKIHMTHTPDPKTRWIINKNI